MSTILDTSGLDILTRGIRTLKNLDATPLMARWADVIEEDNREGVLQGLDKDGIPMAPVRYRPKQPPGLRVGQKVSGKGSKSLKETLKQFRINQRAAMKQGRFIPLGAHVSGINNNLSTAEYQLLGGPPLAPRDQFSRVITNLRTRIGTPQTDGAWLAEGAWMDVRDTKGRPFLLSHFEGTSRLPRRDLRGVRPNGVAKAIDALRNWARLAIREHFGR